MHVNAAIVVASEQDVVDYKNVMRMSSWRFRGTSMMVFAHPYIGQGYVMKDGYPDGSPRSFPDWSRFNQWLLWLALAAAVVWLILRHGAHLLEIAPFLIVLLCPLLHLLPRLRRLSCRGLFGVGGRSGPGRQPAHRRDAEDSCSKIRGNRLDAAQFAAIVGDIAAGNYSDIHIAAFLMIETVGHLRRAALPAPVCVAVHAVFARTAYEDLEAAGAADVVNCDTIVSPSNRILLAPRICDAVRELLR